MKEVMGKQSNFRKAAKCLRMINNEPSNKSIKATGISSAVSSKHRLPCALFPRYQIIILVVNLVGTLTLLNEF